MNEEIIKAWNDNADQYNQWDKLSVDEQKLFSRGFNLGIKYNNLQKRRLNEKINSVKILAHNILQTLGEE